MSKQFFINICLHLELYLQENLQSLRQKNICFIRGNEDMLKA